MVRSAEEQEYREFVVARMDRLRRTAYLLCRDWHGADDLVSITMGKLYRRWRRVRETENPDAYARRGARPRLAGRAPAAVAAGGAGRRAARPPGHRTGRSAPGSPTGCCC